MNNDREKFLKSLKIGDNKRSIKNAPNKSKVWRVRVAVGLMAALMTMGGLTGCKEAKVQDSSKDNSGVTYSVPQKEDLETQINKAEKDFLNRYIKAYNEQYETSYMPYESEIVVNSLAGETVYVLSDGTKVTPGSYPTLTKTVLEGKGENIDTTKVSKVVQILSKTEDGKSELLSTYDYSTLDAMFSGNDLKSLRDKNYVLPQLTKLGINEDIAQKAFELFQGRGNEDEKSLNMRVERYNKAISKADKGYEIVD